MKKHICISLLCGLACVGLGIALKTPTASPAIASYSRYMAPAYHVTTRYSPQYRYRFAPSPRKYQAIRHRVAVKKHTVIKPDPRLQRINKELAARQQQASILESQPRSTRKYYRIITLTHAINNLQKKSAHLRNQDKRIKRLHKRYIQRTPFHYRIMKTPNHKVAYLQPNWPIWTRPYQPGVTWTSSTNGLAQGPQAVQITAVAKSHGHAFDKVASGGYQYGWAPQSAVMKPRIYQLPFHYYSQIHPVNAPDACEAVALRMALSVKGRDPSISMRKFINRIPRNKNPKYGYSASPYKYGDSASIYPSALAKYGRRYDKHTYPFRHVTEKRVIEAIERGDPVVFEGSYRMQDTDSDHTLVLVGYGAGDLEFADPFYRKNESKPISWVSIPKFEKLFHQKIRGARAVIIK